MAFALHRGLAYVCLDEHGDMVPGGQSGFFVDELRILSRWQLRLGRRALIVADGKQFSSTEARQALTNPELPQLRYGTLLIVRQQRLDETLEERITITNHGDCEARFELSFDADADFASTYAVRMTAQRGRHLERRTTPTRAFDGARSTLTLTARGRNAPGSVALRFNLPVVRTRDGVRADIALLPGHTTSVEVDIRPQFARRTPLRGVAIVATRQARPPVRVPVLRTDHVVLERAYARATDDLESLRVPVTRGRRGLLAGVPGYLALFARDSFFAGYQTLLHDPTILGDALRLFAALQGRRHDRKTREEPGRIAHALHPWPLSGQRLRYFSVDATPLFLVVLDEYVRATGDFGLVDELRAPVRRAVRWIEARLDRDGNGLLTYEAPDGQSSFGWKDSPDSVRFADGRIARQPIALVQHQGYIADALGRAAAWLDRWSDARAAERLLDRRAALVARIERDFWLPNARLHAQALDCDERRVDGRTSDPGHLLWSGVVDERRARQVAKTLLGDAFFSGFGIRTRASDDAGYNPISYHNGSVWPFDTSIILAGLVRQGLVGDATRLADGMLEALAGFPHHRPPELFSGLSSRFGGPIQYPESCSPQAFSAGSVMLLVRAILGLDVDAPRRRIRCAPLAVAGLSELRLSRVPLGGIEADVALAVDSGRARVRVTGLPKGWTIVAP